MCTILPTRIVSLKRYGKLTVPKYITRIDVDDPGKAGTHGWEIRYKEQDIFFSDSKYGDINKALKAATEKLYSIYKGPSTYIHKIPRQKKKHDLPVGIRLIWKKPKNKTFQELYVEVGFPKGKVPAKKLYVGTENTITEEKLLEKLEQGLKLRQQFILQRESELVSVVI